MSHAAETAETSAGGGDVYVKVIDKGLGTKWIENIASAYYEETGIKVHVSSDPELVSNLLTLMNNPGSEKEDLYFVGHTMNNWIKWIRNGAIESIDDVLTSTKYGTSAKSRVVDNQIIDMGTYKDKSYLSSYVYSSWGLIYNQTYLNKIDSFGEYKKGEWPSTVQGLIDLCKAVSAFGHVTKSVEITDDNDFIFVPETEDYKAYLKFAKELYDEKLMNQNIYEITDGDVAYYGQQGRVGCSENVAAFLLVGNELADQYATIAPLTSDRSPVKNGEKQRVHICFSMFDPTALIITEKTPYKREIARLVDFFYSEEGVRLFLTGKENVDWTWDDETKTSWHTTYPEGVDTETYRGTITPNVGLGAAFYKDKEWTNGQTNELSKQLNKDASVYTPYLKVATPDLIFTSEESNELAFIKSALDAYVVGAEADFILGRKDIDKDWASFQKTLKQMKTDTLISIYRAAYKKYAAI